MMPDKNEIEILRQLFEQELFE